MVDGLISRSTLRALVTGVSLEDGAAAAVSAKIDARFEDRALVEIVMREGRKREVRRMLEAVGHEVIQLVRTGIGPIRDRDLEPGKWRQLTVGEVRALYSAAARPWDDEGEPSERPQ